jgi:hypothetical protein
MTRIPAIFAPRLLTREQAASYCGISTSTFSNVCPVAPTALSQSRKLIRYDVRLLDRWIDGLMPTDLLSDADRLSNSDWLGRLDEDDSRSRQGN